MDRVRGYTDEERRALRAALEAGSVPACPICGGPLVLRGVEPRGDVPYVRRRGWVRCAACRRTTTLDLPASLPDPDRGR